MRRMPRPRLPSRPWSLSKLPRKLPNTRLRVSCHRGTKRSPSPRVRLVPGFHSKSRCAPHLSCAPALAGMDTSATTRAAAAHSFFFIVVDSPCGESTGITGGAGQRFYKFLRALLPGGMRAADGGLDDFIRDVKVPYRCAAACGELGHQLRQVVQLLERFTRQSEAVRDAGEVAVAEHRAVL